MKKDPNAYLADILQAITDIQTYTMGKEERDFFVDKLVQDGVIRKISIIGEAVKKLPPSFKQDEPKVPWKKISGMRDVVIHDYSEINLYVVWEVVKNDLPELMGAIQRILKKR